MTATSAMHHRFSGFMYKDRVNAVPQGIGQQPEQRLIEHCEVLAGMRAIVEAELRYSCASQRQFDESIHSDTQ